MLVFRYASIRLLDREPSEEQHKILIIKSSRAQKSFTSHLLDT